MQKERNTEKMKEFLLLVIIGGIMGALGLIVRGISSVRSAFAEWVSSVLVAVVVGWAIRDYVTSEGLYNACVATGSFFGIYIVRGGEKIMQGFSSDPCEMIGKLRGFRNKQRDE